MTTYTYTILLAARDAQDFIDIEADPATMVEILAFVAAAFVELARRYRELKEQERLLRYRNALERIAADSTGYLLGLSARDCRDIAREALAEPKREGSLPPELEQYADYFS